MPAAIMFPTKITRANLVSATNQGGIAPTAPESSDLTIGSGNLIVSGTPAAALNLVFEGVGDGAPGTATVKASLDGGATELGRRAHSTWDGNGATERVVLAGAGYDPYASNFIEWDSDADGVIDCAVCAVTNSDGTTSTVRKTTDFSAAASFSSLSTDALLLTGRLSLTKFWGSISQRAYAMVAGGLNGTDFYSQRSLDGITWSTPELIVATPGTIGNVIRLPNGRLLAVYTRSSGGFTNLYCKYGSASTATGKVWSSEETIDASSVNYSEPWAVYDEAASRVVVFAKGASGIVAFQSVDAAVAITSATWAAYAETLFSASAYHQNPTAAVAPDGTVFVVVEYLNGGVNSLKYSYLKGSGTYPALATVIDQTDLTHYPALSCIGGALWCSYQNATDDDADMVMAEYWGTYHATNYPASWTSATVPQFLTPNVWWLLTDGITFLGDQITVGSDYQYGVANMLFMRRGRPARSTGDGALWEVIFDAGANNVFPWDTALLMGNFEHAHIQSNATNSWGAPSVSEEISMIKTTLAVTSGYTLTGGRATVLAGNLVPHELAGERIKFAGGTATGAVYVVDDNEAGEIYVAGVDLATAEAGATTLYILAKRRWITRAVSRYRYLRLLIELQESAEGYYEVPALAIGVRKELPVAYKVRPSYAREVAISRTRAGALKRDVLGPERRTFVLTPLRISSAINAELLAGIRRSAYGRDPFVFIPDISNPYDWAAVALPSPQYVPDARSFPVTVEEILAP